MDFDTLDATQAIYLDEFEDDTDEDLSASQKKPVAYLIVQEQKGLQNKEYPVYEGDNIIGRHESCQICIPSKSLSKEHACITVKSGSHLIFDKGSRNKTKRGKLFLSPDVRYELKDQNELLFADVKCTYSVVTKIEIGEGCGSETEEEKTDSPKKLESSPHKDENSNKQSGAVLCIQSDEEDYASDASSDILQPTQPYDSATSNTAGLSTVGSKSESEGTTEGGFSSVMETPEFLKKPIDVGATLVLAESGSETDDEGLSDLPPQTLVFHDDDDKTENESVILGAATQAIGSKVGHVDETQVYGSEEEDKMSSSDVDMEAATQAIHHGPFPKSKGRPLKKSPHKVGDGKRKNTTGHTKLDVEVEKTQAYQIDVDSDNSSTDTKAKVSGVKSRKLEKTQAYQMDVDSDNSSTDTKAKVSGVKSMKLEKTQAYEMDVDSDNRVRPSKGKIMTMETQKIEDVEGDDSDDDNEVKKASSSKKVKIMTMETQKIEDAGDHDSEDSEIKQTRLAKKSEITTVETQKIDVTDDEGESEEDPEPLKSKALTMMETQKMDAAAEDSADEDGEEKNDDDPQLSGLFCMSTLACDVSDEESDDGGKDVEADANFDDATQAVGDTVDFEDEEKETIPKRSRASKKTAVTGDGDATAPVEDATMPVDSKADVDPKEEDATMPVGVSDATVSVNAGDATMPISASDATMPISASDATMPVSASDATMPISASDATMPVDTSDATMPVDSKDDAATLAIEETAEDATMPLDGKTEDATVPIAENMDDATAPIASTIEDATMPIDEGAANTSVSDTVLVSDTVAIADTVPVSDTVPKQRSTSVRSRRGRKPPASTADTLPVTDVINDGTQEFGVGGANQNDAATLPVSEETGEDNNTAARDGPTTVGDTVPLAEDASLPTLLPQIVRGSDVSDDESTPEMVPESQHDDESTSLIKLPEKSPFKSALVDPITRSRSPSPKRVAFAEPEESNEEPHPQTTSSRGRRRRSGLTPEPSLSAQRKGRGRGTKKVVTTDTSGGDTSKDETNDNEVTAKSRSGDAAGGTETGKDDAEASSDQTAQAAEDKTSHPKRGTNTAASRGQASTSEPRRSGRARKTKRFADDSEEEKEDAKKEREQKDIEMANTSALVRDEDETHKTDSGDKSETENREPEGDEQEQKSEDKNVTKKKASRADKTKLSAQKRASSVEADERAGKKAKQSSDDSVSQSENKDEDGMETEEGNTTDAEEHKNTQKKDSRASRKSGRHGTDDAKMPETETEPSGQDRSRSKGRSSLRGSRTAEAETVTPVAGRSRRLKEVTSEESEGKEDIVSKSRRGSRAAKMSAERSDGAAAATVSDDDQELPSISKKSRKSAAEKETMDTEGVPEVTDVTQEDSGSVQKRVRAQAAKKSQEEEPETEKEIPVKENAPQNYSRGRRNQLASGTEVGKLTDQDTPHSGNKGRKSRATRGKLGAVGSEADTVNTKEESSEADNNSHKRSDTGLESSTTVSSKKRVNKPQVENVKEADENSQESRGRRRGRYGEKAQSPGTDEVAGTEQDTGSSTRRRGRVKQKDQETEEEESTEKEESTESSVIPVTGTAQSTEKGRQSKKSQGAEPSVKARGQTRKSLRSEKEESENSQSEYEESSRTRRGHQVKSGTGEKDASVVETAEESSHNPPPTRRGRQTTDPKSDPIQEKHSQDHDPAPRKGGKAIKTDSKAEQHSQDSTITGTSRQSKRARKKDTDEVSEHGQEDVPEDVTPAKRGRQAKKTQGTEKDLPTGRSSRSSSVQSLSQDSQESIASHTGRKGRKSQNTADVDPKADSGNNAEKESKRGGKRRVTAAEAGSSDVVDTGAAESGDGPTPQKRGRQGKESAKNSETSDKTSPVPAKRGRHSDKPGSETPTHSGQKPEPGSMHSPSLRRSSLAVKPKIIFTGVLDEQAQKIVKELGGQLAQSVQECTHLVTDKVRRTVKFLAGVARGVTIVTLQWLESCKSSGMFVDGSRFIIKDTSAEKQYKFSLQSSLHKAVESPMLEGYRIHVTKSVRPEPQQMKEILQCAGAEWLASMPKKAAEKTMVVSCEEDKNTCQAALKAGIDVVSAEFILTGILRQEVDIDCFRLFSSNAPSSRSRR